LEIEGRNIGQFYPQPRKYRTSSLGRLERSPVANQSDLRKT
jgi:hypothetical protein